MATRSFKQMSIATTNTPQPWFYTTLNGAVTPSGNPQVAQTLTVGSSALFLQGDRIVVGSKANSDEETLYIVGIPSSTTIQVMNMQNSHVTASFVRFANSVNSAYCQSTAGNAGIFYIGNEGIVVASLTNVVATVYNVASGQPLDFSDARTTGPNDSSAGEWWIAGTASDLYLPSFGIV